MFSRIFLGLVVSSAMVPATYSSYPSGAGGEPANNHSSQSSAALADKAWSDIFPGINPGAGGGGNEWVIDQVINEIQNPIWNGILNTWNARQLAQLNEAQLTQLAARIREICPNGISFAAPTMITEQQYAGWNAATNQAMYNTIQVIGDMPLAAINLSIEIPFLYERIDEIIESNFDHAIMGGSKRNTLIADGVSLGQAWSILNEFIEHYRKSLSEAEALLASAQISPQERTVLERLIEGSSELFNKLAALYTQINGEFEKPSKTRSMQLVEKAMQEFVGLLRGESMTKFRSGLTPEMMYIMQFVAHQPTHIKFKVMQTFKNAGSAPAVAAPETTAQMLDRLLAVPGRAHEIAQAIATGGHEDLLLTLRLDGRLWNVFQLNAPARQMHEMDWQMQNVVRQQIQEVATRLHLSQGSHVMAIRQSAADRHVYQVVRFQWNQWNYADNFTIVGEFEIREAKEGDRTELYNPLRTHGRNSIQGTIMEQRVHGVMAAQRVHAFGALPEDVRHGLRTEIDRYADERDYTRMENQGLAASALTREERTVINGADAEMVGKSRAAKVASELKERLVGSRVARMRTHGDELADNPAEHLQMRVHNLFNPERLHATRGLSERERQFLAENFEGGYLDTVENAVAARQVPFDPASGARVHYDAERMHNRMHELAPYNVAYGYGRSDDHSSSAAGASGLAAPTQSYDNLGNALADYDMQ